MILQYGTACYQEYMRHSAELRTHFISLHAVCRLVQFCNVPNSTSLCLPLQDGSTPLHYAAAFGQTHVLETLVKAGIAVDNRDDARNTPLHLAAGRPSHTKNTHFDVGLINFNVC